MMENLSRSIVMLFYGLSSLHFWQKRDYRRHVHESTLPTAEEHWAILGCRLKNAADRLIGKKAADIAFDKQMRSIIKSV